MTKKINFKTDKEYGDTVTLDLDDFIWIITNLYYMCNAVGCVPSMTVIEDANNILDVIYNNDLNLYIE